MNLPRVLALSALAAVLVSGCSPAEPEATTPVTIDPRAEHVPYEAASERVCSQAWRSGGLAPDDSIGRYATTYANMSADRELERAKWEAAYDGCARGLGTFLYFP